MITTEKEQKLYHAIVILKGLREQTATTLVFVFAKLASQVKHVIHVLNSTMVIIVHFATVTQTEAEEYHAQNTMENVLVKKDIKD